MDTYERTCAEPGGFARIRDAMSEGVSFDEVAERIGGEMGEVQRELVHPEIEADYSALGAQTVDSGPTFTGHDGWVRMWKAWLEPWESYEFGEVEIEPLDDERVLLETLQVYRGRTSGAQVEIRQAGIWTARDGKLIRYDAFDTKDEALASLAGQESSR